MSKYLLLLGVFSVPSTLSAQDADWEDHAHYGTRALSSPGEPVLVDADQLAPITVTANGIGSPVEQTGQAVTLIARDEIDAVQGSDPARILQRVPGLTLARNGGVGGFTGVRLRGAEAEQLLVLIDGVRVADPAAPGGGYDFGNLLLGTVGRIDVLRGANSTIWGSDAIGGVMDLATRAETGMAGSFEYGARDTLAGQLSAGVESDRLYAGIRGAFFDTDGFSAAQSGSEPDGFRQFAIGTSAFLDVTDTIEAFAHADWREGRLEIDGFPAPDFLLADTGETQETRQFSTAAGLAYSGHALTLRAAWSLADTARDNFNEDGSPAFDSEGREQRVELRGDWLLVGSLRLAFGAEHAWSRYEVSYDVPARTGTTGGYAQLGWESADISAHLGARVQDHQRFGTATTFGADASWRIGGDWRLRASIGEGFKAPSLFQLFSFYGTPTLRPEESTGGEIGIERGSRSGRLHLALSAYRRDSDNLIGFAFDDPARPFGAYANTTRARAQGIEAEAQGEPVAGLRLGALYNFLDAEDRATGLPLARRPRHSGTLWADWTLPFGLALGADLRLSGGSRDNAAGTRRLDGYEVLDLRASLPLGEHLELFGRVENVFDTAYQTAAGYASPPRGVFAGARARM